MTLKNGWYKAIQVGFIILTLIGVLFLGRIGFVMSMSAHVNNLAKEGTHNPAQIYYMIQAYTGDFMEPYKAYYNIGTTYAVNEDYDGAEVFLTAALSSVDYLYSECYIRNNLSIVYEKQGDYYKESEMDDIAESYYDKAVTTVQEAPPACFPPPPSGGGESENENSPESDPGENPNNPPAPNSPPSDMPSTGEQMEKTEESSQSKGDEIREEKGDSQNGKKQVENEMNQSQGETQNREDQTQQEQQSEANPEQVDKPW